MKVAGKTLDNFFDRGGSMSPIIATTLRVQDSKPVQTKSGKLVYIKSNLCRRFLGEVLLAVAGLHEKGIIHRDLKPQNIMLVENDLSSPFRIIDFGSAVFKGKKPVMDDLSEIYAPPEAPFPDGSNPEAYDIYTIGVIALRILMPSMTAGEAGVQQLGSVTVEELPAYGYDLTAWAQYRATNQFSTAAERPLNDECKGLLAETDLLDILSSMLQKLPKNRPSAEQVLARLGPEWQGRLAEQRAGIVSKGPCGKCGQPVYATDAGRTRNSRGVYFHAECSSGSATYSR
jgi:serine/threonine protein kinase